MDRAERRRTNLLRLVEQFGTTAEVARRARTPENYLTQIIGGYSHPSGKPREIGNTVADRLEAGCDKPLGWLDQDHNTAQPDLSPSEQELLALWRRADDPLRLHIMTLARLANEPA